MANPTTTNVSIVETVASTEPSAKLKDAQKRMKIYCDRRVRKLDSKIEKKDEKLRRLKKARQELGFLEELALTVVTEANKREIVTDDISISLKQ